MQPVDFGCLPPKHVTQAVLDLCDRATKSSGAKPVFVSCKPIYGAPYNECFSTVERHIATHGGGSVLGWAIWERKDMLIEAELHAIWHAPSFEIIDISPRPRKFEKILFVPDKNIAYTGFQVDNIRTPLAEDDDIKRFIFLSEEMFRLTNMGKLKHQFGMVTLPRDIGVQYERAKAARARLEKEIVTKMLAKYR